MCYSNQQCVLAQYNTKQIYCSMAKEEKNFTSENWIYSFSSDYHMLDLFMGESEKEIF